MECTRNTLLAVGVTEPIIEVGVRNGLASSGPFNDISPELQDFLDGTSDYVSVQDFSMHQVIALTGRRMLQQRKVG